MTLCVAPPARAAGSALLGLPGTHNLRLVCAAGVREGALLRSDALDRLDATGWRQLARLGVRTVVDLRGQDERGADTRLATGAGIEVAHRPVLRGAASDYVAARTGLDAFYADLLEAHAQGLVDAVRALADAPPGGVLVHCSAGKDRTGLVVALALLVAGVDRGSVLADYAASEEHLRREWLAPRLAWLREVHGAAVVAGAHELIAGSPPRALEAVLARLDLEWGSARQFLEQHGLSSDALGRLRGRLSP